MAKTSKQTKKICSSSSIIDSNNGSVSKAKRTRKSIPRESPQQRSSVYRGVTRHRWTGRYEAHLWDKNCCNESHHKKGRQVYLGAYDDEAAAAHAYDLAALKYWGYDTILNFPVLTYEKEFQEMEGQSKEEYIGSLRRKSSGFSRGVSKYRGVARHHHNGRWEARIGRVFGNKYLYLGTYATQEEAATAYDMAAIEYRGLNAVTNFDLSRYIKWLKPNQTTDNNTTIIKPNPNLEAKSSPNPNPIDQDIGLSFLDHKQHHQESSSSGETAITPPGSTASSSLGLLLQSPKFKEMLECTSSSVNNADSPSPPPLEPPRSSFPDDIQTYFDCHDSDGGGVGDDHDNIFGDFASSMFPLELDT